MQQPVTQFLQALVGDKQEGSISDAEIDELINKRQEAKANKDFARADAIRAELKEVGIELEDAQGGTTWRRA